MPFTYLYSIGRRARLALAVSILAAGAWSAPSRDAFAVVATLGNVSPAIPSNGIINANFFIGDTSYGQLSNGPTAQAPNPTPITITGANNNVFIGDDADATGSAAFTGFMFDLIGQNALIIGNNGSGSLSMSGLSRASFANNINIGNVNGASGRLFINDLGTGVQTQAAIIVGNSGVGLVQALSGSRVFAATSTIGANATADGTVTVSGNETTWEQSGAMTIGSAGRGYMQLVSQARMETGAVTVATAATGVGSANVSGTGSIWEVNGAFTLGASGVASLDVNQGGRLNNTGAANLATMAGGEATALISGTGSVWNAGSALTVGGAGSGVLRVFSGGRVNAATTTLANVATARGEVSVDGAGTVFDVTGTLDVGGVAAAEALFTVSNSAVANVSGQARVGTGGEMLLGGGRLNAGGGLSNQGIVRGAGRINGAVTNAVAGEIRTQSGSALVLGNALSNAGLVHMNGGEMEVLGLTTNTGDIDIRSGLVRFSGGLNNNNGAQFALVGGVNDVFGAITNAAGAEIVVGSDASAVFHDALTNNGEVFLAPGAELLTLENLSFTPSSLVSLQLSSFNAQEEFTPLEISGQATLAGQLDVQLASGFTPELGDMYQLISASGGLAGSFGAANLPALSSGLEWDVNYDPTSLTLSVVAGGGIADFDGDGDVDSADLTEWRNGFGTPAGASSGDGDADTDGDVDGRDFLAWQRRLGSNPGTAPAVAAVPEPSFATLTMAAAVMACACGRLPRRDSSAA